MKTTKELGQYIKKNRQDLGITQVALALACGTGARFIIDLEKGKETCQMGKVLKVIETLGISLKLTPPTG